MKMTNTEIIASEVIAHGIYTKEQVEIFAKEGVVVPVHTYAEWKAFGFQVKRGEKAIIETRLWRFSSKAVTIKDNDGNETEEQDNHYYLAKAFLFDIKQVEKEAEQQTA
jgi:hypothetical protein